MSDHDEQPAEPDDIGDHEVPVELSEAHEAIEFQRALDAEAKRL